jgi:hypothetical protein
MVYLHEMRLCLAKHKNNKKTKEGKMKKIIWIFLAMGLMAGSAWASPFLVCDKYPTSATQPDYYKLIGLPGSPITVQPDASGTYGFKWDAVNLLPGAYTATAIACKGPTSGWPVEVCSDSSNPLSLSVPGKPPTPQNPGLVK